ncbi:MAG: beta-lactamase family protein [Anaerolineae bacterium]|nr:beta-lactamase family protein [Anaerolineae bacterium]
MNTVSPSSVGLSPERLKRVDRTMERYVQEGKLSGILNLVARRGQVAHLEKRGWMDVEAQKPIEFDTLFRIYSMTKPITSVAVMILYEEGHFFLTDPVAKYIPAFEDTRVFVRETETGIELANLERPITIHDLLTHTAGLSYGFEPDGFVDKQYQKHVWKPWGDNWDISLEELVRGIARCPLRFQPGSQWFYSMATDVLGYLVQVVSGQPFDVFLQERILGPLDMVDTAFEVPASKLDRFATNYIPKEGGGFDVFDAPETSRYAKPTRCPAGGMGLVSTIGDYYRFAQMLANQGELDGQRLLGRKTVELMAGNHLRDGIYRDGNPALGFGLGFGVVLDVERTRTLGSVGAYGWGGAATTRFGIDPQEELVTVQMTQLIDNTTVPVLDDMAIAIYQAIVN